MFILRVAIFDNIVLYLAVIWLCLATFHEYFTMFDYIMMLMCFVTSDVMLLCFIFANDTFRVFTRNIEFVFTHFVLNIIRVSAHPAVYYYLFVMIFFFFKFDWTFFFGNLNKKKRNTPSWLKLSFVTYQ